MDNLINCLKARAKCIWLKTYEEDSVIHDIVEAVAYNYSNPLPIYLYNFALGAKKIEYQEQSESFCGWIQQYTDQYKEYEFLFHSSDGAKRKKI